jgi:hypothetical protein
MSLRNLFPLEDIDDIIKRQHHLAYFSHIPYSDTDDMSRREFDLLYSALVEQKEDEQQEMADMADMMDSGDSIKGGPRA